MPEAKAGTILGTAITSGAVIGGAAFAYLRFEFFRWVSCEASSGDVFRYSLTRPRGHFLSLSFGLLLGSALAACFPAGLRGEGAGIPGLVALGMLTIWFAGYPLYVGHIVRGLRLTVDSDGVALASRKKGIARIPWDELEAAIVEERRAVLLVARGGRRLLLNRSDRRFAWHVEGFDALLELITGRAKEKVTEVTDLVKAAAQRKSR